MEYHRDNLSGKLHFLSFRYQLIARSPVFFAMLCGILAEKGEITIDDVDPDAFTQMLKSVKCLK